MIDIHSHILAGIDDGAKTMEDSIEMAKLAVKEGITTIIATPHHKNGVYENYKNDIVAKVNELNEALKRNYIPLTVKEGQEVRIHGEIIEGLQKNEVVTINDAKKYLLIEFPSNHVPRYAERLLYDIAFEGIVPVIVHPERNQEFIENPNLLYSFVKKGALTQITAGSVTGVFGKKIQKFSTNLLEANLTHFIASDAHNVTNRSFHMKQAYAEIRKIFGRDLVDLLHNNADKLLQNKDIYKEMPERIKKKKFLGIF